MITAYALLLDRCGLSHREAALLHAVRPDTVKSWAAGRNRPPQGAVAELRALYVKIERAAREAVAQIVRAGATPDLIELGLASDDQEARGLGWPCVGTQAAMLGLVAAWATVPVAVVPRGSTRARRAGGSPAISSRPS
jgi:hypothetical protein